MMWILTCASLKRLNIFLPALCPETPASQLRLFHLQRSFYTFCIWVLCGHSSLHSVEFHVLCNHPYLPVSPRLFDSVSQSADLCVCLFMCTSRRVGVCRYLRFTSDGMEGSLPLILVMWPFANLISLACSGQTSQIDNVCVFVCVCACTRASACHHSGWWFQ